MKTEDYLKLSENEKAKCREQYKLPDEQYAAIKTLIRFIWENPELSNQEFETSRKQTEFLKQNGFAVTSPYCGKPTAYRAEFRNEADKPCFAFCAELDALPGMGHACGHNLISGNAITAALIAKQQMIRENIQGKIVVLGCPAEETDGGKIDMAEAGAIEDIDALMLAHPISGDHALYDTGYAGSRIAKIYYHGEGGSGVARCANPKYVNPLDAQNLLYQAVALRRHYTPHDLALIGCITNGGERANMIPVMTSSIYTIRSQNLEHLLQAAEMLKEMAEGAAMMTGTKLQFELTGRYQPTLPCHPLSDIFLDAAQACGIPEVRNGRGGLNFACTDFGNLSQLRPGVHVHCPIGSIASPHTQAFNIAANSEKAYEYMFMTGAAMACTALKFMQDPVFREQVKAYYMATKES